MNKAITQYYLDNLLEIPFDTRFHFLSRMYLWTNETVYLNMLMDLKKTYIGNSKKENSQKIGNTLTSFKSKYLRYFDTRKKHLEALPDLIKMQKVLAIWLMTQTIYSEDITESVEEHLDFQKIKRYLGFLQENRDAWYFMSTYAINFMYFVSYYNPELFEVNPSVFLSVFEEYFDQKESVNVQIGCYFLTHCIIAESWFYAKPIERERYIYMQMVEKLGKIILDNFEVISLDIKCEYLVCEQICGVQNSELGGKIAREVQKNWNGEIIIDPYKTAGETSLSDAARYEHTNVLYVMSRIAK